MSDHRMPDWLELWRELVEAHARGRQTAGHPGEGDIWRTKARSLEQDIQRRWSKPDAERAFVVSRLDPAASVLDIGAGTGAWAALLARHAARVTALEPSQAMVDVMAERLAAEAIDNVTIVQGHWPGAEIEPHDFTLCSHAMYGVADLEAFVRRMNAVTRRTCFFVIRAASLDGVMADAARHVWGHPFDSPNFAVAYNALLQMGLYPSVVMGDADTWQPWAHPTLEAALYDVKWRLDLLGDDRHDAFLAGLLSRRLERQKDAYVWPRALRTAVIYWPGTA